MKLIIPYPPSVNRYWRTHNGRMLISREGRQYRQDVQATLCYSPREPFIDRLDVEIEIHPPDHRRRDIDNVLKAILDSLQHAGVYEDDSQIDKLTVERMSVSAPAGHVVVRITPIMMEEEIK